MTALTTKVRALSVVAEKLGSDLTSLRAAGRRSTYLGLMGNAEHLVRDAQGRLWGVDLVLGEAALQVGVAPRYRPA